MTHGTECSRISVWLSYLNGAIDKVLLLVVFTKLLVLWSWLEHKRKGLPIKPFGSSVVDGKKGATGSGICDVMRWTLDDRVDDVMA